MSYPQLSGEVDMCFKQILGDEVYKPVVDPYHQKLSSSTTAPPLPERQTPPHLRIVVSPDDDQAERLAAESKPTAMLKWAVVKDYIGSAADTIITEQKSVY